MQKILVCAVIILSLAVTFGTHDAYAVTRIYNLAQENLTLTLVEGGQERQVMVPAQRSVDILGYPAYILRESRHRMTLENHAEYVIWPDGAIVKQRTLSTERE